MKRLIRYFSLFVSSILFMSFLGCASTNTQESTGEYVDDSVITAKVKAALLNEPTLNVMEINVETFKGVVQLSGFVTDPANIKKATDVARSVAGVRDVKNDIRVKA